MAVTVAVPSGVGTETDKHSEGYFVAVIDGHLHVEKRDQSTVAIYAPGKWANVVVHNGQ